MSKHSEACCTIPPVIATGYKPNGKYIELGGLKTYVTGPSDATSAIFYIYDICGYMDQTIQGADILATSDKEKHYQVFMPDFWEGKPANVSWLPPDTEEKQKQLNAWFSGAAPPKHLPKIEPLLKAFGEHNPKIQSWGVIGYCWGGKMVSLLGAESLPFKAGVQTSPAMVDPQDAPKVKIPMMVLASKEEPADDVKKYGENLTVKKHVETFDTQVHGWMSARADLENSTVKSEYERGYKTALGWFHEYVDSNNIKANL